MAFSDCSAGHTPNNSPSGDPTIVHCTVVIDELVTLRVALGDGIGSFTIGSFGTASAREGGVLRPGSAGREGKSRISGFRPVPRSAVSDFSSATTIAHN